MPRSQRPLTMRKIWTAIKNYFSENVGVNDMATIKELSNGKFALINRVGETLGTYSRLRDARRGAVRKGLSFAF